MLKKQIRQLEEAIEAEKARRDDIKLRAGFLIKFIPQCDETRERITVNAWKDQEKELEELRRKIEEVYMEIVDDNVAGMGVLQVNWHIIASLHYRCSLLSKEKWRSFWNKRKNYHKSTFKKRKKFYSLSHIVLLSQGQRQSSQTKNS